MQISTPTQALDSPLGGDSPRESGLIENFSADSLGNWSHKTQKKNKQGIFAKLLEGLAVKNTKGNDKSENAGETGKHKKLLENALKPGEITFKPEVNNLKKENAPKTDQNAKKATGVEFSGSGVIPGHQWNPAEARTNVYTFPEDFPARKGKEVSRLTDSLTGVSQKGSRQAAGNVTQVLAGKEETGRVLAPGTLNSQNEKEVSDKPAASGPDNAKGSARGTAKFLSFSFREMENSFLQSQGGTNPEIANLGAKFAAKGGAGEKEDSGLSESRGKKGKLNIDVRDLRTKTEHVRAGEAGNQLAVKDPPAQKQAVTEIEIPVDLAGKAGKGEDGLSLNTGKEASGHVSFEDALAGELRGNLSPDIVRDAMVIVRNGGEGTIRLSLHPASLGNVKIRLEMTENKITGHIILESNEAFRAFERELPVLEKAFRDSGFSETSLEMSFAQDGGNFNGREQRQEGELQALAPVHAASRYESGTEWIDSSTVLPPNEMRVSAGRSPVNLLI